MTTIFLVVFGVVCAYAFGPKIFRVKWFAAKKAVEEKLSNPIEEAKYDIAQAKKEQKKKQEKLAELMASQKGLKRQRDEMKAEAKRNDEAAKVHAKRGDKVSVGKAATRVMQCNKRVAELDEEILVSEEVITVLQNVLEEYAAAIQDAQDKSVQLEARIANAELREELTADVEEGEGLAGLKAFESKVQAMEDKVSAKMDMHRSVNDVTDVLNDVSQSSLVDSYMQQYAPSSVEVHHSKPAAIEHHHVDNIIDVTPTHHHEPVHHNSHYESSGHNDYGSHSHSDHSNYDSGSYDSGGSSDCSGGGCD